MGDPRPRASEPTVWLRDLQLQRPGGFALHVEGFRVGPGQTKALLGPSGSGKSSLIDAILGLDEGADEDSSLSIAGERAVLGESMPSLGSADWRERLRREVGWLPQDAQAALDPLRTIASQVAELAGGASRIAILDAMSALGVEDAAALIDRYPHQISGGQAQRALLAVALLRRPALMILDEPTAGLDAARIDDLAAAISKLRAVRPDMALLISSHGLDFVRALGAEPYRIEAGRLVPGWPELRDWPRLVGSDSAGSPELVAACRKAGVRRGGRWIVEDIDLELHRGESVALLGPSGSGKTTIGRLLAGHIRPDAGRVERPGARTAVQLVFQDAAGSLTAHRSPRSLCREASRVDPPNELLRALGLDETILSRASRELSGGQQRRSALLRALCVEPRLLVLDEPTAGLDREAARRGVEAVVEWMRRRDAAGLWITHDDRLATAVSDRIVRIEGGHLC